MAVAVDADGKKDETRVPSTTPLDPNALLTTDQSNILKTVQEQARKLAEARQGLNQNKNQKLKKTENVKIVIKSLWKQKLEKNSIQI